MKDSRFMAVMKIATLATVFFFSCVAIASTSARNENNGQGKEKAFFAATTNKGLKNAAAFTNAEKLVHASPDGFSVYCRNLKTDLLRLSVAP